MLFSFVKKSLFLTSLGANLSWFHDVITRYDLWSVSLWSSRTWLSMLLPATVLMVKLAFSLPPLSGYLWRIRRGWERLPREGRRGLGETGGDVQCVGIHDLKQETV